MSIGFCSQSTPSQQQALNTEAGESLQASCVKVTVIQWQYSLLAPSVCYPQMVWGCMCVCIAYVWMEWTWSMHYVGISTYQFILYYANVVHTWKFIPSTHTRMQAGTYARTHEHTHTHILIPFEDRKLTGLKVNSAYSTSCIPSSGDRI